MQSSYGEATCKVQNTKLMTFKYTKPTMQSRQSKTFKIRDLMQSVHSKAHHAAASDENRCMNQQK